MEISREDCSKGSVPGDGEIESVTGAEWTRRKGQRGGVGDRLQSAFLAACRDFYSKYNC